MKKSSTSAPGAAGDPPATFEAGLEELDTLVQGLERGELTLDESVAAFERGTGLLKALNSKLRSAETRVKELIETEGDGFSERDLDAAAPDNARDDT